MRNLHFKKGKLVLNIAEVPFKCPVAPLEFIYMADHYFTKRGIRDEVEIKLVTPLTGAFTKPKASAFFSKLAEQKNLKIETSFDLVEVDCDKKQIISGTGQKVDFDHLLFIR